jgi:hypothetical protein
MEGHTHGGRATAKVAIDQYIQQYPLNNAILLFTGSAMSLGRRVTEYLTSQVSPPVKIVPLDASSLDDSYPNCFFAYAARPIWGFLFIMDLEVQSKKDSEFRGI